MMMMEYGEKYQNFTVIIPEHKRPEHLRRLLDYFLSYGIKVIVTDSSDVEFKYLSDFDEKIVYRFYPKLNLAEKLAKVISLVVTPFVVMCANDDFLVPEAIHEIITFLEKNPDYNSGQGIYTDFTPDGENIHTTLRYVNTTDINLNNSSPSERLYQLQSNYFQYYYAVFRTETFKKTVLSVISEGKALVTNLCLLESYMSCYAAIDGKHIILPVFYSARENIADSAASHTDTIPTIILQKKYEKEYNNYLILLSEFLSRKEQIVHEQAKATVINAVEIYIQKIYPDFFSFKGKIKRVIKANIKRLDVLNLHLLYFKNIKSIQEPVPQDISASEHWKVIKSFITKYNHIYIK